MDKMDGKDLNELSAFVEEEELEELASRSGVHGGTAWTLTTTVTLTPTSPCPTSACTKRC